MARRVDGRVARVAPAPRLLVICHTHPRITQGGAEITAYEQFRRAVAAGGEAWFLSANGAGHSAHIGATLQQPFGPREFLYAGRAFDDFKLSNPDPAFASEFGALLDRLRPTDIHFHHYLGVGLEALACAKRHAPDAQIALTLHEYLAICHHFGQMVTKPDLHLCDRASAPACHRCFPERDRNAFFLREQWIKRFFRCVDQFVAPSAFLRQRYIEWGVPADKIVVRLNQIPERPPVPARPRQPGAALRVALFGQLSRLKGLDVFLRAASLSLNRPTPLEFRIYGSCESQPNSFQDWVRTALAALPPNVTFKGRYRNEDVLALMAENDVIVVPSIWWENAPLVIDEARRAGCLVIGSDLGGVGEAIRRRPADLLFGVGDSAELADTLQRVASGRTADPAAPASPLELRSFEPGQAPRTRN